MRILIAAALAAFFVSAAHAMPKELETLRDQTLLPTVQIDDNCSGQIVYSKRDQKTGDVATYILTAKHCVSGMTGKDVLVDVPTYDKKGRLTVETRYYADVDALSWTGDSALVKLKDADTWFGNRTVKLAPLSRQLFEGEQVWTVGYPAALTRTITTGLLNVGLRNDVTGKLTEFYRATPDIVGGSSGGGLYHRNDAGDYELIGTTTAGYRIGTYLGLYTTIGDIQAFLKNQAPIIYKEIYGEAK